jgi:competence protein ComEC
MLAVAADDFVVPLVIVCAALGTALLGLGIRLIYEERRDRALLRSRVTDELDALAREQHELEERFGQRQRSIDERRIDLEERRLYFEERMHFEGGWKQREPHSPFEEDRLALERERIALDREQSALDRERHSKMAEGMSRFSRVRHPVSRLRSRPRTSAPAVLGASVAFFLLAVGLTIAGRAIAAPRTAALAHTGSTGGTPLPGENELRRQRAPAEIDFVDVGQGDAVVMRIGRWFIVSDAGNKHVARVDSALRRLGANGINVAILSHPNRDHVENFLSLLTTYGWTIENAVVSHSDAWGSGASGRLMHALKTGGTTVRFVTRGRRFLWGGASWEILSPPTGAYTSASSSATNNASVVYTVRVNGIRTLFTGDIGRSVARQVAERWLHERLGRATIFLATHHGSKNGSVLQLLDAVHPKWAVLSTGPNAYHHPSVEAISRLERIGASIWCTNANGTVAARISTHGRITWLAARQVVPWWSATTRTKTGVCVRR